MSIFSRFSRYVKRVAFAILLLFVFFSGIIAGNLDRLDSGIFTLLQYQDLLPRQYRRFLPGGSAKETSGAPREELSGRIIRVYDGDTATLLSPDGTRKYKIRFFGIDAPEASQDFGRESAEALKEKILGENVRVLVVNTDRYGRCVGKVSKEGRYINLEMVAGGFAWYYRAYAGKEKDLEEGEARARRAKTGLWAGKFPPIPPWEYRRAKEKGKDKERASGKKPSSFSSLF